MSGDWAEVKKDKPCEACGKPDWCARTHDGLRLKCERSKVAPRGWHMISIRDGAAIFAVNQAPVAAAGRPTIEKVYTYRDAEGNALFDVVRFKPKDFRVRHAEGKDVDGNPKYVWNMGGAKAVLYNLPGLLKAPKFAPVFFCEGEKDVHAVLALGLTATCSPGGAGKFSRVADIEALGSKTVIILAHPDAPGLAHAFQVKERLSAATSGISLGNEAVGSAHVVNLKEVCDFDGKDVFDWVDRHGPHETDLRNVPPSTTAEPSTWLGECCRDLLSIAKRAQDGEIAEPAKPVKVEESHGLGRSAVSGAMADVVSRKVEWLWPGRIARGKLTILAGDPGTGKSFISLDIAARVSAGLGWPLCAEENGSPGGVVLLNAEDDLGDTKSNVSADDTGLSYHIQQDDKAPMPHVAWDNEPLTIPIEALVAIEAADGATTRLTGDAVDWLTELFESRTSIPAMELYDSAKKEGYSRSTLRRARIRCGLAVVGERENTQWSRCASTTAGNVCAELFRSA